MWYIKLLITLFLSINALFSMDELVNQPRHVITFQLFNKEIVKNDVPNTTIFCIDNQGNLTSSETGITYILSNEHLKVIQKSWSDVRSMKPLQNDYLMQTELQQKNNNYISVGINYDKLPTLIKHFDAIADYLSAIEFSNCLIAIMQERQLPDSIPLPQTMLLRSISNNDSQIESYSTVDRFSCYGRNYITAQLKGNKIILDSNGKPYNNEGVIYQGEINLTSSFFDRFLNLLISEKSGEFIVHLLINNNSRVMLLVKDVDQQWLQKKNAIEKESLTKKTIEVQKKISDEDTLQQKKINNDKSNNSQKKWPIYMFYGGIAINVIFIIWYFKETLTIIFRLAS
jgi:hypothetical protein